MLYDTIIIEDMEILDKLEKLLQSGYIREGNKLIANNQDVFDIMLSYCKFNNLEFEMDTTNKVNPYNFEISKRNAKDDKTTIKVNPIHIVNIDGVPYYAMDEFDRPEFNGSTTSYINQVLNLRNKK